MAFIQKPPPKLLRNFRYAETLSEIENQPYNDTFL